MSSNSPCAACKFLRQKCTQECVFAPYFPPDQLKKFEVVHKVFGASNVKKLINELNTAQREDAVNSLAYEAEARLRDPVYGCVGHISVLQTRLKQAQSDLINAKKELAAYIGPQAMMPLLPTNPGFLPPHMAAAAAAGGGGPSMFAQQGQMMNSPMMGIPTGVAHHGGGIVIREPQQPPPPANHHHHQQQQQVYEAQQMAAAAREHEIQMLRNYEQQQIRQGQELLRYNNNNGGFDNPAAGAVTVTGYNQINDQVNGMQQQQQQPSLALGQFEHNNNNNLYLHHQQPPQQAAEPHHGHPLQAQILLHHAGGHQLQGQAQIQQPQHEGSVITHQQQPPLQKGEGSDEAENFGGGGGSNL